MQGEVTNVNFGKQVVQTDFGNLQYDFLILACGATHSYFGNEGWARRSPGLKTIQDATEIRRQILSAYEKAERTDNTEARKRYLTFVIVGGGPTGVELAGAIGEMSRFALARDFRSINAKATRVFLMEAGPKILAAFPDELAERATRDLEKLGVQIWTSSAVSEMDELGVTVGEERIEAATVIWAAGVKASPLGNDLGLDVDRVGRVVVEPDLSLQDHSNVFVAGDQASFLDDDGIALPGIAPVAVQQGRAIARNIIADVTEKTRREFRYVDKGMMATIGRNKAVVSVGKWKFSGRFAWVTWLLVHIYFLTGFRNRMFVVMQWAWSYITFRRGARLIVGDGDEPDPKV